MSLWMWALSLGLLKKMENENEQTRNFLMVMCPVFLFWCRRAAYKVRKWSSIEYDFTQLYEMPELKRGA